MPYYRTDGPGTTVLGHVGRENPGVPGNGSTTVQMYAFTNTLGRSSSAPVEGVEGKNTLQYPNANRPAIAIEDEQHAQGAVPFRHSAHQFSTWRNAHQYQPTSPVTGHMAPMADVASSSRAPYPAQYLHAQYAQRWGHYPKSFPTFPSATAQWSRSPSGSGQSTPKVSPRRDRNCGKPCEGNRQIH